MISKTHTACKNCIFATWKGDTQIGCKVGRIEQYRNIDPNIVLEVYDEDKEFYTINNRICLYYRNEEWLKRKRFSRLAERIFYEKVSDTNQVEYDDIDEYKSIARKEMQIKCHFIITYNRNQDITNLEHTLESIQCQKIQPTIVTVINRNLDKISNSQITTMLEDYFPNILLWKVQGAINLNLSDLAYIDMAFDATKYKIYTLYITVPAGILLNPDLMQELDEAINDDLQTFHMIQGEYTTIVPKQIHYLNGGNSFNIPLSDKLNSNNIKSIEDICPIHQK